jgi:hypothetical protein
MTSRTQETPADLSLEWNRFYAVSHIVHTLSSDPLDIQLKTIKFFFHIVSPKLITNETVRTEIGRMTSYLLELKSTQIYQEELSQRKSLEILNETIERMSEDPLPYRDALLLQKEQLLFEMKERKEEMARLFETMEPHRKAVIEYHKTHPLPKERTQ